MKVLLIDDHELFRDGMRYVLSKLDNNIQIFDLCSYEDALPVIENNPELDLILLDLDLPGLSDTDALRALRLKSPSTPVVVISSNADGHKVQQVLDLGAQGYIPKSTNSDVLVSSLKLVLSGGIYIPPEILAQLASHSSTTKSTTPSNVENPLTPRQRDVLTELVNGSSNKEIATHLGMAEPTVRVHIAAILKALDVTNRTRAAHDAIKKGWVAVE